ncbi:MAG: hypothetical protein FWF80_08255 [Defluviitaleaceae bacterium]|nr:hypothetical protein [Defluviitaleaceae bacterium]
MEYFKMYCDERIRESFDFSIRESLLSKSTGVHVDKFKKFTFVDFIEKKIGFNIYFFMSPEILAICKLYEPELAAIPFSFIEKSPVLEKIQKDALNGVIKEKYDDEELEKIMTKTYWKLETDFIKTDKNLHELKPGDFPDKHFFIMRHDEVLHVIVSIYLCESILRRLPVGVKFKRLKGGKYDEFL